LCLALSQGDVVVVDDLADFHGGGNAFHFSAAAGRFAGRGRNDRCDYIVAGRAFQHVVAGA